MQQLSASSPMFEKSILITGGAGFIGSNFIRRMYHAYPRYRIFNLDALTYAGNLENLADIELLEAAMPRETRRYEFIKGDIVDSVLLDKLFGRYAFDQVFHFAAETHVDRSFFNVSDFVRTNIEGTRALLDASRSHRVPRFVHISTDEIYGSVHSGFSTEEAPLRPSNLYSASKAGADLLVQAYTKSFGLFTLVVRGSNNFGPYQYPEKLVPLATTAFLEGTAIPIHGSGQHTRSWLHVDDFCSAVDTIAHRAPSPGVYNVSGECRTNLEVLGHVAAALQKDLARHITYVNDRPGADMRYAPDSGKLEREFGWKRNQSIESSMHRVVRWYLERQDWWRKIKTQKEFMDHYQKQSQGQWY